MDLIYIFTYHVIGALHVKIFFVLRGRHFLSARPIKLKNFVKVRTKGMYLSFKENFSPSLNFLRAKKKTSKKSRFFFKKISPHVGKVGKSGKKQSNLKSPYSLWTMGKNSPSNCENRKSVAFTVWEEIAGELVDGRTYGRTDVRTDRRRDGRTPYSINLI